MDKSRGVRGPILGGAVNPPTDPMAQFLADYDAYMLKIGGCSDGGCMIDRPKGMHTNGGCRCWDDRTKARRFMIFVSQTVARQRAALAHPKETGR